MIQEEFPECLVKEVVLGLTKTNFNNNRHKVNHRPIDNLYEMPHLTPEYVAEKIYEFMLTEERTLRIAP